MDQQLQNILTAKARSGWESTPAMHQIIGGYAKFHAALVVVGAIFAIILVTLSVMSWLRFKRISKIKRFKWPFEKKVYFCFASLFTFVALFLALITAANITNTINPLPGFTDSISSVKTNAYNRDLNSSFTYWINSGKVTPPTLVSQSIHKRRVFHAVRAIVSGLLLVGVSILSIKLWKRLIARHSSEESKWTIKEVGMLSVGIITVTAALFMMLAFIANFQSVLAPIANTLQFGP